MNLSTDAQIIKTLREVHPAGIAGTDLAGRLGITRGAIWARIDILRSAGFEIEASPHIGYRLISSPDNLIGDDIQARLKNPEGIGKEIHVYRETTSTNEVADRLARGGAGHGTVVMAENQTGGKGRMGRSWESHPSHSLLFSLVLRPEGRPADVARMTLLTACAITKTLRTLTSSPFQIKWPNDIFHSGKKIGGILTELRADMDFIHYAIVGVGLNILQSESDFPDEIRSTASSIKTSSGVTLGRPALASHIFNQIESDLQNYNAHGFSRCLEEMKSYSCTLGKWIELKLGQQIYQGRAESIDESGGLWMRTESGKLQQFNGGEVTTQISME